MKRLLYMMLLGFAILAVSCQQYHEPADYVFSAERELVGVVQDIPFMVSDGRSTTTSRCPAICLSEDSTFYVYGHFGESVPLHVAGRELHAYDTIRVLGRTAESQDYGHRRYFVVEVDKVLDVVPGRL